MMTEVNKGFNIANYNEFKAKVMDNPAVADYDTTAVAHWIQGESARVVIGDKEIIIGGADDEMDMMEVLLSTLAACDAAMVALHCSFMGLKVEQVTAEVKGHFNAAAYMGIEDAPGAGYDRVEIKLYVEAPSIAPEQLDYLKHICESGSPVGDTFSRSVPIQLEVVATE